MASLVSRYLVIEEIIIQKLSESAYLSQFIHDKNSGRITLFLLVIGTIAFFQELYITIEMSILQKETYDELSRGKIDESLKLHKLLVSDEYHGKEYEDVKSGIIIEEFEDRDKFFSKPVHVSNVYIDCNVKIDGDLALDKPLRFHVEITPEDFENEKRYEFGSTLRNLRVKLYHLFKDSAIYDELNPENKRKFTISQHVEIFNRHHELLDTSVDDVQLCFLKIETKDTIYCNFLL